jgi:hypothetical protein
VRAAERNLDGKQIEVHDEITLFGFDRIDRRPALVVFGLRM